MQARSVGRKKEILDAAEALLIEYGYEPMTFKMVAERSGAAIGSITHFYKTKEALVAAVAKDVIDKLVADTEALLKRHDLEVAPAVRSLIAACSKWPQRFPHYQRLARYIEPDPPGAGGSGARGLQVRLERVLDAWARPLIAVGRVVHLSSAQLYAILIAPALCDTTNAVEPARGKQDTDWIEFLSSAALKAIIPQENAASTPKRKGDSRPESGRSGPDDLFGRGAA